jgi:hypothetical protein
LCGNPKKILIGGIAAGFAILVVSFIVDWLIGLAFPYDMFSLGGMRSVEDPMMMLFFLHPWVLGFAMAIAFEKFKGSFKSRGWCRGKKFGLVVWLLAGLPSAFIVFTSMTYPIGFTISTVVGSLLYMIAAGITLEKVIG